MTHYNPFNSAVEMANHMRVSSVMSPILKIFPYLVAALVVTAFSKNTVVQTFFMWAVGTAGVVVILSYFYILFFRDPKLLQSEEHVETMRALEVIGDQHHTIEGIDQSPLGNNPSIPAPMNEVPLKARKDKSLEESHE